MIVLVKMEIIKYIASDEFIVQSPSVVLRLIQTCLAVALWYDTSAFCQFKVITVLRKLANH